MSIRIHNLDCTVKGILIWISHNLYFVIKCLDLCTLHCTQINKKKHYISYARKTMNSYPVELKIQKCLKYDNFIDFQCFFQVSSLKCRANNTSFLASWNVPLNW